MDITSLRSSNKKKYPLLPLGPLTSNFIFYLQFDFLIHSIFFYFIESLGLSIPKPEIHVNTSVKKKKQLQRLKYEDVKGIISFYLLIIVLINF